MKLYTEEQVKLIYQQGWYDGKIGFQDRIEDAISFETPIELPSDEEIGEIAQWVINNRYSKHLSEDGLSKVSDFEMYHHIIKLIKEQLLNQNK